MKLLDRKESQSKIKKENDELIMSNIRLRKLFKDITDKLNTIKESYEPAKLKKLQEFEVFCEEILKKKSKLLEELQGIENEIVKKKDIYYGLIAKQDLLDARIIEIKESEKKLEIREIFMQELETKWREKTNNILK